MSVVSSTNPTIDGPTEDDRGNASSWLTRRFKLCVAMVLLAHLPLLFVLARYQWSRPHYQSFPIVLAGFLFFVVTRWKAIEPPPQPQRSALASLMFYAGMFFLTVGVLLFSSWLAGLAMILVTGSLLRLVGGRHFFPHFFGPWCLLWLILPLPLGLHSRLITQLQASTSSAASHVLDLIGINHLMTGNVLEFPERQMLVEEACSGIQSFFALLYCVGLFVVWARRPVLHTLVLLLSAAFWALLANLLRLLVVAVAYARYDIDLATGWSHEALGIATFSVALIMTISTDQLLMFVSPLFKFSWPRIHMGRKRARKQRRSELLMHSKWSEEHRADESAVDNTTGETCQQIRGPWRSVIVAGVCGVLAVVQLGEFALAAASRWQTKGLATVGEKLIDLDEQSLPEIQKEWKRVRFDVVKRDAGNTFGKHSKIWTYQSPICEVAVSFDYPFYDWHELNKCYSGNGWQVASHRTSETAGWTTADAEIPFVELILTKPLAEHGYVLFALIDERGIGVQPPNPSRANSLAGRIMAGPLGRVWGRTTNVQLNATTYQIQVFAPSDRVLSESEREEIRQQFLSFVQFIRQQHAQIP